MDEDWRKRWGFGAGGKLIENKLFWFYAYDQFKRNFPGLAKPATPSTFFNQWADLALPGGATCTKVSTTKSGVTTVNAKLSGTGTSPGDLEACTLAWRAYGGNYAAAAERSTTSFCMVRRSHPSRVSRQWDCLMIWARVRAPATKC